jgi:hypothetical protein
VDLYPNINAISGYPLRQQHPVETSTGVFNGPYRDRNYLTVVNSTSTLSLRAL